VKRDDRPAKRAMIDASSAILLVKAGLIELCGGMFHLQVTRAVFEEVTVPDRAGAERLKALAGKRPGIEVMGDPAGRLAGQVAADLKGLHRGERDSLHHFLNGAARFVILDDGPGVRVCRRHSIPHVNALLCPKLLLFAGKISQRNADLFSSRIIALGRYTDPVRHWAEKCGPSDLSCFIQ